MSSRACRLAVAVAVIGQLGCASAPPPGPPPLAVPEPERAYLLPPSAGLAGLELDIAERLDTAHRELVDRGNAVAAYQVVRGLGLEPFSPPSPALADLSVTEPDLAGANVLLAQIDLLEARYEPVRARLEPLIANFPEYLAAWVLLARAEELLGDVPRAYAAFRHIAVQSTVAATRAAELQPRAIEITAQRVVSSIEAGRLAEGERSLALLRTWGASEPVRLAAERVVAAAKGDQVGELAAIKGLVRLAGTPQRALIVRWAELELLVGDAAEALKMLQQLDREQPGDRAVGELLTRARFRWRLQLLPREVRDLANRPELNRGDFAALLYWLVPQVRRGQAGSVRIASDVLDHPNREAIVRVVNLGLMDVDERVHRFSPERPIRRGTALAAIVRLLQSATRAPVCLDKPLATVGELAGPDDVVCARATRCGLLTEPAACLSASPLTGEQAVDWIQAAVELFGEV